MHTAVEVALFKHGMERKLKESEELYRVVVQNLYDSISIRSGGKFVFVNKAFLDLHGLKGRSEVIGLPRDRFILPEDKELVKTRELIENTDGPNVYEYRIRRTGGDVRIVETANVTITYQGRSSSLQVLRDVTERRRELEALLGSRRLRILRLIAGGMPNKEIALTLSISLATVGRDVGRIKDMLGVNDRAQAVAEGSRRGLI